MISRSSPKKNILFIETGVMGGGSFESLYYQLKGLNREKFCPIVVFLNETDYVEKVKNLGIKTYLIEDYILTQKANPFLRKPLRILWKFCRYFLPWLYPYFIWYVQAPLIRRLEKIVKTEQVDLIELNNQPERHFFGFHLASRTDLPCIDYIRSECGGAFEKMGSEIVDRYSTYHIAITKYIKSCWVEKGLNSKKTEVILNAIPKLEANPMDIHKRFEIEEDINFFVGYIGRLIEWKAPDFLLKAFNEFNKKESSTGLIFAGEGPKKKKLIRLQDKLNLSNSVYFLGWVQEIYSLIYSLDVLVLPSVKEPFGRVLLEAMALKVPVIATNSGGIPEIIEDERNGLLVECGDKMELAEQLERIKDSPNLRQQIINEAYHDIETKFSLERYTKQMKEIYNNIFEFDSVE